jgi:hypothetical protein
MVVRYAGGLGLLLGDLRLEVLLALPHLLPARWSGKDPSMVKAQCGDDGGGDTMVLEDALLLDPVPILGW